MRYLTIAAVIAAAVLIFQFRCYLWDSSCIASQGARIHSSRVVEMLDNCEKFTFRKAGAWVINRRIDISEQIEKNGIKDPLVQADFALAQLRKSPLAFERDWDFMNYGEIAIACNALRADFYNQT
ncbi:MAG: hypothetical protein WC997_02315 [Porticoccaceae bacterium]